MSGELKTTEEYIFQHKEPGVDAHKKIKKDYAYEIPMEVDDPRGNKKLPKVPLHGSWLGDVFAIGYVFNVFVKFKSLTDLGEGDKISLPVRIFNTPKLV